MALLATHIHSVLKPFLKYTESLVAKIILDWQHIASGPIRQLCELETITPIYNKDKKKRQWVLVLRATPSARLHLVYYQQHLIDQVNTYIGQELINSVRFSAGVGIPKRTAPLQSKNRATTSPDGAETNSVVVNENPLQAAFDRLEKMIKASQP